MTAIFHRAVSLHSPIFMLSSQVMEDYTEDIKKILEAAVQAPSGDNSQPWRFEIRDRDGEIRIFNIPERDKSLYNYGQMASCVAHGALIENNVFITFV